MAWADSLMGNLGLAISFALLAVMLVITCLKANVGNILKFVLISVVLWYSVVLYNVPNNFSGWAKADEPEDQTIVISVWVKEPNPTDAGGIHIWGIKHPTLEQLDQFSLRPELFIQFMKSGTPRNYVIPYDRELHKRLLEAQKKQKEKNAMMLWHRGKEKKEKKEKNKDGKDGNTDEEVGQKVGKGEGELEDKSGWILKNPSEIIPKQQQQTTF